MTRSGFMKALLLLAVAAWFSGCDSKQGVRGGDAAPEFSARDTAGQTVSLGRFRGKLVVLYFWTNSCCGERVKLVEPLYRRYRDRGVTFIGVDVGDSRETTAACVRTNGLTFPMVTDGDQAIFRQYRLAGFPTIMLVDPNGIVRQVVLGEIGADQLEKLVLRQLEMRKKAEDAYEKSRAR